jgi:hypothetical protein
MYAYSKWKTFHEEQRAQLEESKFLQTGKAHQDEEKFL